MASRKPIIPMGSGSKSNPHTETSKDGTSGQTVTKVQAEGNNDYERRKARVALRTGSPKPPTRVSLRSVRTKTPQTPPPVIKAPSRLSGSPSRLTTSSKGSIRTKPSPERRPWGAPTIRVPPYHEESISRRKKTSAVAMEIPVHEDAPPRHKYHANRYTIDALLALRPPPTARYSALSYSQLETGMVLAKYHSAPLQAHYTVPAVQPHFNKLPMSYWEQQSAYYGGETATNPIELNPSSTIHKQDLHHEISPTPQAESPFHSEISQTSHAEDKPHPVEIYQTLYAENQPTQRPGKQWKDEQAAIVQDLECRIRSALSHRGRRKSFGTPKVRSVRWDPAVLPPMAQDTAESIKDTPIVVEAIIMEENATARLTLPEEDAKGVEIPIEENHVDTPSASEYQPHPEEPSQTPHSENESHHEKSHTTSRKKQKKEFYQYMKSITELKRGDRKKLLQLLEALKNLDSDSSDTDTESQLVRRKNKKVEHAEPKSGLDPTAIAFHDHSPFHADATIRPALKVPRQRLIIPTEHHDPNEPIWVKSVDLKFDAQERGHKKHNQENEPQPQVDVFRIMPYTVSSAPFLSKVYMPREITKVNPKLPIIDLATGRIPVDDGPGREAHVVAWGNLILDSFQQKYPLTGVQRAEPPAPIKSTHAATIQQRLEYLLMEQKEKQARGEGLAERSGNLQGSKLVKHIYQAEKDAMKRLKAEIRRDEAQRKLREPQLSTSQLKMRMQIPGIERISEASTCVESLSGVNEEENGEEEEDGSIVLHHD